MNTKQPAKKIVFQLLDRIGSSIDLRRIIRELEMADDYFYQANLRAPGVSNTPPKTTKLMNDLFALNSLSILDARSRQNILTMLKKLETKAPAAHISFAVEPSSGFMEKIVVWARKNIHPHLLIDVGLQPSVIVGCNLRSTNKVFDMSLRNRFETSKYILTDRIKKMADTEVKS